MKHLLAEVKADEIIGNNRHVVGTFLCFSTLIYANVGITNQAT